MNKWKRKSLFLIILIIIGIVMGILFSNILNSADEKLVITKITDYFNNLKEDIPIKYWDNFLSILRNNIVYLIIIWILGLSIIGLLLNNFLLFFKSFIMGFTIGSVINIYLYQGIILGILYIFSVMILNIFIYGMMVSLANDFSIKLFNLLFKGKEYSFKNIIKRYFRISLICIVLLLISSLYETFVMPFVLKLFSFLIK